MLTGMRLTLAVPRPLSPNFPLDTESSNKSTVSRSAGARQAAELAADPLQPVIRSRPFADGATLLAEAERLGVEGPLTEAG